MLPVFLVHTDFKEKYGLDKVVGEWQSVNNNILDINFINIDLDKHPSLPFENSFFEVVTMLAVFEHIEPAKIVGLIKEIYRLLKPNGALIITTPTPFGNWILKVMSIFGLVSRQGMAEHQNVCSRSKIHRILVQAGFAQEKIKFGYFRPPILFNRWVKVIK